MCRSRRDHVGSRLRRGEDRKEARLVLSALHPLRRSPRLLSRFLGSSLLSDY